MSRRTEYRNEVKTRLSDRTYDGMQAFKALQGIESDSAAMARMADLFLFGTVGNLPSNLIDRSANPAHSGTPVAA
ncbi:hypothetical protein [Paraburkholderia youngii]|uniref:Uncharacterized protein n=1 Tax=Paraburkholderia youngii TaxID=2782701 RepID=A0ABX2NQG8_9BURK|nr:hypothetical protein [Paraburkholderia youngii]NVI06377.1 hypothetical protein [Paraburkholderia youngii]